MKLIYLALAGLLLSACGQQFTANDALVALAIRDCVDKAGVEVSTDEVLSAARAVGIDQFNGQTTPEEVTAFCERYIAERAGA